ncbi:MAG: NADH dehydrogenase subunit [Thermoprotei archaeon]|nr:MAG: NADH dehydrogenase subunit [Thermoprotei archaeon]
MGVRSRKVYSVPVGPYHPALEEMAFYKVYVEGERIVDALIKPGFNHRGIEKLAMKRSYRRNVQLFERVCGICSAAHTTAYCVAVERCLKIDVPKRAQYIRAVQAEANRIHSHLLWFGVAMHVIGFDTLFMHSWAIREDILDVVETLTGNRVNYSVNTIGGVRRDITPEMGKYILEKLNKVEKGTKYLIRAVKEDLTIKARTKEVGVLTKEEARKYCDVGPTARASGIEEDVRRADPHINYEDFDFEVCVEDTCDVYARIMVRLRETLESIKIVRQAIKNLPEGPLMAELTVPRPNEDIGRTEAPRGELIYYIRSNYTNVPERVKLRTPTFVNLPSTKPMLIGDKLADAPQIIVSIDPCLSCNDRVIIIDVRTGKKKTMLLDEIIRRRGKIW